MHLVVCHRICYSFRLDLFKGIAALPGIDFTLLFGSSIPGSKVQNPQNISGFNYQKLPTIFIPFIGRTLLIHIGLLAKLRKLKPDVIICEGESHFIGFVVAAFYRQVINRQAKLIHWSLGGLPGKERPPFIRYWIKRFLFKMTDRFIVYSSYGKQKLMDMGCSSASISTVINVPNCRQHIKNWQSYKDYRLDYRKELGVENKFTVLYVGAFEAQKNISLLLDIAREMLGRPLQFILVGDGIEMPRYKARIAKQQLHNVTLAGKVSAGLYRYYIAADVFLLPGRGGIVIGEALSYRLPVIVHHADGTELDLIRPGVTGVQMEDASLGEYVRVLEDMMRNPAQLLAMGQKGQALVSDEFNMEAMIQGIKDAVMQSMLN